MSSIIIGLIIMVVGFIFVAKTEWFLNNFGRIAFFEKYLGMEGGSRLGYKLVGLLALFIGFLVFSGMIEGFLMWILGPIIRLNNPQI
ncbi:MAG: hypothetical protein ABH881_03345 [bacterium]